MSTRIRPTSLAVVTAAAVGIIAGVAAASNVYATQPATTPACATEDSIDCFWDADARGNGEGRSFYTDAEGNVYYVTPAGH